MKIPPGTTFRIKDWETLFEISSSRKLKKLGWVAMPNGHDSMAYCRMMARKDGPEIFAAWILIVQLASRCANRGILASSDGRPYCPEEMAAKTRGPERIFSLALPYLCQVGWMYSEPSLAESADVVVESTNVSAGRGGIRRIHNTTLQNRTEQTPNPLEGVFPENLISDKFKKAWSEWVAHRVEIKKPLKPTQITKQLKRLSELGEAGAIEALEHTMENGWTGIRQPNQENPNGQPNGQSKDLTNNTPDSRLKEIEREMKKL
jgi:hypothetical protein